MHVRGQVVSEYLHGFFYSNLTAVDCNDLVMKEMSILDLIHILVINTSLEINMEYWDNCFYE